MTALVATCKVEKTGMMRYISHLDLMRLFTRAGRRAALPVALSHGFNPHPRVKIEPAVKLGLESRELTVTIELSGAMERDEFGRRLQDQLPGGIRVTVASMTAKRT